MGILSDAELAHFVERGYLVKRGVVSAEHCARHQRILREFLRERTGVDAANLRETAGGLRRLGRGFGGFLEYYWGHGMCAVRELQDVYQVFRELLAATYASATDPLWPNAYGPFDPARLTVYINRCSFRVPTAIVERFPKLQRGTGPHLDIDPIDPFRGVTVVRRDGKRAWEHAALRFWHPLQAFVAVSSTPRPGTGGFCTVPGFHRACQRYYLKSGEHGRNPLRWGNSTHLTARHDRALLDRFEFVPAAPGDLVIWDWRMPHMNEDRNDSDTVRETIYVTYLPDTANNRVYAREQLEWFRAGLHPDYVARTYRSIEQPGYTPFAHDALGRRLMGIDPW